MTQHCVFDQKNSAYFAKCDAMWVSVAPQGLHCQFCARSSIALRRYRVASTDCALYSHGHSPVQPHCHCRSHIQHSQATVSSRSHSQWSLYVHTAWSVTVQSQLLYRRTLYSQSRYSHSHSHCIDGHCIVSRSIVTATAQTGTV